MSRPLLFCMIGLANFARERGGQSLSFCFNAFQSPSSAFNAVLLHDGFFFVFRLPGLVLLQTLIFFINFFLPREYTYRGL